MYPNQPTPPPRDYLDQIAAQAQPPKKAGFIPPKLAWGIGIAVGITLILLIAVSVISGAQRGPSQEVLVRLTTTQPIVDEAQDNLKSSQLRSLNGALSLYFTNTIRDSAEPFGAIGVSQENLPSGVTSRQETAITELTTRLEDARLNAQFDRIYAQEMDYYLSTLLTDMQEAFNATNNESLRTFLSDSYDSLQPTQQAFADFNEGSN